MLVLFSAVNMSPSRLHALCHLWGPGISGTWRVLEQTLRVGKHPLARHASHHAWGIAKNSARESQWVLFASVVRREILVNLMSSTID